MTAKELREKYLQFFSAKGGSASGGKEKGHAVLPSASLIPENDPTVLFTTAGMHPLVPFLLGEEHPSGKRLTSVQKCIRTGDIDEVGDNWHLTFFEMLGNWSLGDYFKEDAIKWSWEFLTDEKWLGLDKERLAVSVFAGDNDAPFDEEAYNFWRDLEVPEERVARLPKKDNWWGPAGKTGPCGPDTEIFYWASDEPTPDIFDSENKNWVEIWNNVFMQYNKTAEGKYEPLAQKNIDTGMGLERTVAVLNGKNNVYETELFAPLIDKIKETSEDKEDEKSIRIIADHIKTAVFILADPSGVAPLNIGQGYVLRRLIRRAIRYAKKISMASNLAPLAEIIINIYKEQYPELAEKQNIILGELKKEEEKFAKTLERGLKEFEKLEEVTGKEAFNLFSTYGFPLELTKELAKEKNIFINGEEFENEFKKHQELSRTASAGVFKCGLADASDEVKKLHTATHLLHTALKKVLGDHVEQRGSNITAERLRFDFSHPEKMSPEDIKKVEEMVNEKIKESLPVKFEIMPIEEARKFGAIGLFGDKYGEKVKVYSVGDFSKEICGGPHASNTGELGHFKILKEEASSAGVRRIKAVLE